jgi:hypothetical protein
LSLLAKVLAAVFAGVACLLIAAGVLLATQPQHPQPTLTPNHQTWWLTRVVTGAPYSVGAGVATLALVLLGTVRAKASIRYRKRRLALAAGLQAAVLAVGTLGICGPIWRWDWREHEMDRELRALGKHPWAGSYYRGDGLVNFSARLAPQSGYLAELRGCLGVYSRSILEVEPHGDELRLLGDDSKTVVETLRVVRWGGQQYLVPVGDLQSFLDDVRASTREHDSTHLFYLHRDDVLSR